MSEKSAAQKLLIKPGGQVRLINPPAQIIFLLDGLPDGTVLINDAAGPNAVVPADVLVLFANGKTDLETLLPGLRTALTARSILWIAYHKGTSRIKTDINRDTINAYAKTIGLQGVAMVSLDEDWSALRLKLIA